MAAMMAAETYIPMKNNMTATKMSVVRVSFSTGHLVKSAGPTTHCPAFNESFGHWT